MQHYIQSLSPEVNSHYLVLTGFLKLYLYRLFFILQTVVF